MHYIKPYTTIYNDKQPNIIKPHHLIYTINAYLIHQYQDLHSYIKNYKKHHGNQYQIPIFMNDHTTLIIVYGLRSTENYAINIHAIQSLKEDQGCCRIDFKHTHILIQKQCRYIKKIIQKSHILHQHIIENIFIDDF